MSFVYYNCTESSVLTPHMVHLLMIYSRTLSHRQRVQDHKHLALCPKTSRPFVHLNIYSCGPTHYEDNPGRIMNTPYAVLQAHR